MLDIPVEDNSPQEQNQKNNPEVELRRGPAVDIAKSANNENETPSEVRISGEPEQAEKKEGFFNLRKKPKEEAIIEPGIEIEESIGRKSDSPMIFTLLAALIVFSATGYFYYGRTVKAAELETRKLEISEVDGQLSAKDIIEVEERADSLSKGINSLKKALKEQLLWTQLFSNLSDYTLQAVSFKTFSIDGKGNLKIEAKSDTYGNVAKAIRGFEKNENIKKVELEGLNLSEGKEEGEKPSIEFSLSIEYDMTKLTAEKETKETPTVENQAEEPVEEQTNETGVEPISEIQ